MQEPSFSAARERKGDKEREGRRERERQGRRRTRSRNVAKLTFEAYQAGSSVAVALLQAVSTYSRNITGGGVHSSKLLRARQISSSGFGRSDTGNG